MAPGEDLFKFAYADFDILPLFEAKRSQPNTWYLEGPDKVNLEMIINYLQKRK